MIGRTLLINLLILFTAMTLAFLIGRARRRLDTVDISWGLAFTLAAWATFVLAPSKRSLLAAAIITVWGTRLALHIYQRSRFRGDDQRYTELTKKWHGDIWARAYFSIFLLQGALVWVISLPVMLLAGQPVYGLRWTLYSGLLIWLAGFLVEVAADRQLQNYLRDKKRPTVMEAGLWRYSRHPNYFGELTQWWGIAIMALSASYGWIGLVGPILLTYLIVFVSGLPPIEDKRKNNPDYQAYKRRTSPLIPLPPRN